VRGRLGLIFIGGKPQGGKGPTSVDPSPPWGGSWLCCAVYLPLSLPASRVEGQLALLCIKLIGLVLNGMEGVDRHRSRALASRVTRNQPERRSGSLSPLVGEGIQQRLLYVC
jgi:hypothetical protein